MNSLAGTNASRRPGFVYAAQTEAHPGLLKIGYTHQRPHKRIQQFSTGSPEPFQLVYSVEVTDPRALERELHRRFAGARVNEGREFFRISVAQLHYVVRQISEEVRYQEDLEAAQQRLDAAVKWRIRDRTWRKHPIWTSWRMLDNPWIKRCAWLLVAQLMGIWNHMIWNDPSWTSLTNYFDGWRFLYMPLVPLSWLMLLFGVLLIAVPAWVTIGVVIEKLDRKSNVAELEAMRRTLAKEMRLNAADLKI
jgi:hypothetical protein